VLRRLLPVLSALTVAAAACGSPEIVVRSEQPEGPSWFSLVVDVTANSGSGLSLATDAEGNPHLAYLALPEEPPEGEEAPGPLAPTLPAVMHAHLVQDGWTRGPVAEEQDVDASNEAAIAVDADGVHHVAWTTAQGVRYSSNAGGEFAEEPEVVAETTALGVSIAVDGRGAPWVAYYEEAGDPEGPGALVRVATPAEEGWEVETAAESLAPEEPAATAIATTADGPLVAFGSDGQTLVARQRGTRWVSETVDEDGGLGVSMALDADGVSHLAYLTGTGDVKHAHPAGDGWEISDIGAGAAAAPATIAVDVAGVHHVAWQTAEGLAYATNAGGDFTEEELPGSAVGGARPRVGAGAEGAVYLAFYDREDTELQMVVRAEDEPLLAVPAPEETVGGGPAPAECQPEGTELAVAAEGLAFDTDCLAAPAGEAFTIEFTNQDAGVPHNVAIYTDQAASQALFQEPPFPGPDTVVYEPEPIEEEGNFFFRCDVHPTTMSGTFVVAGAEGGGGGGGGG
jgi:hypothetical protein